MPQEFDVQGTEHVSVFVRLAERVHVLVDAADDLLELAGLGGEHRRGLEKAERLPDDGEPRAVHAGIAQALQRGIDGHPGEYRRFALRKVGALKRGTLEGDEYGADEQSAIALRHLVDVQRVVEFLDEHLQQREVLAVLRVVVAVAIDVLLGRQQFVAEDLPGGALGPQVQEVGCAKALRRAADGYRQHVEPAAQVRSVVEGAVHRVVGVRVAFGALVPGRLRFALDHRKQLGFVPEVQNEVRPARSGAGLGRGSKQLCYSRGLRSLLLDGGLFGEGAEVPADDGFRLSFVGHGELQAHRPLARRRGA